MREESNIWFANEMNVCMWASFSILNLTPAFMVQTQMLFVFEWQGQWYLRVMTVRWNAHGHFLSVDQVLLCITCGRCISQMLCSSVKFQAHNKPIMPFIYFLQWWYHGVIIAGSSHNMFFLTVCHFSHPQAVFSASCHQEVCCVMCINLVYWIQQHHWSN